MILQSNPFQLLRVLIITHLYCVVISSGYNTTSIELHTAHSSHVPLSTINILYILSIPIYGEIYPFSLHFNTKHLFFYSIPMGWNGILWKIFSTWRTESAVPVTISHTRRVVSLEPETRLKQRSSWSFQHCLSINFGFFHFTLNVASHSIELFEWTELIKNQWKQLSQLDLPITNWVDSYAPFANHERKLSLISSNLPVIQACTKSRRGDNHTMF